MKYVILESGGKQYKAVEGSMVDVDLLPVDDGQSLSLSTVLLVADGDQVAVGTPLVKGAKLQTTVVGTEKGPKVVIFKYSPKKRIRVKTGHRQQYTRLKIEKIEME